MERCNSSRPLLRRIFTFVVLLGLVSTLSYAGGGPRHILIDFDYPSSNDPNGEAWATGPVVTPPFDSCNPLDQNALPGVDCVLDFTTQESYGAVSLGFNVNIAGKTYTQVFINRNGVVSFNGAIGSFNPGVNDLASLAAVAGTGNPFIAAFYPSASELNLPSAPSGPPQLGFGGGAEYGRGLANPDGTDDGNPADVSADVLAFKASWVECSSTEVCTTPSTAPVEARIVLYNRFNSADTSTADGDFDLRLEYGVGSDSPVYDTGTSGTQFGVIGFNLGSAANTVDLSGSVAAPNPVPGATDIYYQFRKGVLVGAVTAVTVPNVVNKSLADATSALDSAGLTVGTTTKQASATIAAGNVISQDPLAGVSAPSGSAVNLVLSSGPTQLKVPNVVGDTLSTATTALTKAGFMVGTTTQQSSSTVAAGRVISQSPGGGTSAAAGSAVNLVLSSGPSKVTVPGVIGQTVPVATQTLKAVGLKVGTTTTQASSSVPSGSVISQSPAAGASVALGSAVNLVVSSGSLRGDVNGDGQVDLRDLLLVLEAFGKRVGAGDPRDLNGDHVINLKDAEILVTLCTNRGCLIRSGHP